jgi:hypothetical protein
MQILFVKGSDCFGCQNADFVGDADGVPSCGQGGAVVHALGPVSQ